MKEDNKSINFIFEAKQKAKNLTNFEKVEFNCDRMEYLTEDGQTLSTVFNHEKFKVIIYGDGEIIIDSTLLLKSPPSRR